MCIVSNIGDGWRDTVPDKYPWVPPYITSPIKPEVSREEFEKLKKEMEALKRLLKAAKKFDEETGQKDCELDEKIDLIKKVAKIVGVDFDEVFKS